MLTDIDIAAVCHEVNRAYCQALGDHSQPPWDEAPQWQRDSAVNGVQMHRANPNAGPQASHENWMREKLEAGWTYGPVKDPERKQHHCLVPFDKLPVEQQAKDYIFRAVVHWLSARTAGEKALSYEEIVKAYVDGASERCPLPLSPTELMSWEECGLHAVHALVAQRGVR